MSDKNLEKQESERGTLRLRLELELSDFQRSKLKFLQDVASMAGVQPEVLWITDIRKGCVLVHLDVPKEVQDEFERLWNGENPSVELLEFIKKYNVTWIRFDDMVERDFMVILRPDESKGRKITWLHLSDLHLRSTHATGPDANKWAQDNVTDEFVKSLPHLLEERRLVPDFLFFTGDIAYSGQDEEYEEAKDFLQQVVHALPKQPKVFLVPGNHDVTWSKIDISTENVLRKKLITRWEVITHLINDDDKNKTLREQEFMRLENFFKFFNGEVPTDLIRHKGYYYTAHAEQAGLKIGIAGLNSAWRSTRKDKLKDKDKAKSKEKAKGKQKPDLDEHELILGEPQVNEALKEIDDTQLRIGLLHHPPFSSEWFKVFDVEMQDQKLLGFDFLLRGHEHRARYLETKSLTNGDTAFHMASTALYFHDEYRNGFNVVSLDLDTEMGSIYFWTYLNDYYVWAPNVGQARNGFYEFPLPKKLRERLKTT